MPKSAFLTHCCIHSGYCLAKRAAVGVGFLACDSRARISGVELVPAVAPGCQMQQEWGEL